MSGGGEDGGGFGLGGGDGIGVGEMGRAVVARGAGAGGDEVASGDGPVRMGWAAALEVASRTRAGPRRLIWRWRWRAERQCSNNAVMGYAATVGAERNGAMEVSLACGCRVQDWAPMLGMAWSAGDGGEVLWTHRCWWEWLFGSTVSAAVRRGQQWPLQIPTF